MIVFPQIAAVTERLFLLTGRDRILKGFPGVIFEKLPYVLVIFKLRFDLRFDLLRLLMRPPGINGLCLVGLILTLRIQKNSKP